MIVLGIDTATRLGSVGIIATAAAAVPAGGAAGARATLSAAPPALLAEVSRDAQLRHGETLLSLVDECLARAGLRLEDVTAVAVSIGPGSFTGLRVGLATAKGLVLGGGGALIGVATLEALAATLLAPWCVAAAGAPAAARQGGLVCACLDARKGEVYSARFVLAAAGPGRERELIRLSPDRASSPAAMLEEVEREIAGRPPAAGKGGPAITFLGDGAERYAAVILGRLAGCAEILPFSGFPTRGAVVAALGAQGLLVRGADDLAALAPLYARASQAEEGRGRSAAEPA